MPLNTVSYALLPAWVKDLSTPTTQINVMDESWTAIGIPRQWRSIRLNVNNGVTSSNKEVSLDPAICIGELPELDVVDVPMFVRWNCINSNAMKMSITIEHAPVSDPTAIRRYSSPVYPYSGTEARQYAAFILAVEKQAYFAQGTLFITTFKVDFVSFTGPVPIGTYLEIFIPI